jgi:hypothetical protein
MEPVIQSVVYSKKQCFVLATNSCLQSSGGPIHATFYNIKVVRHQISTYHCFTNTVEMITILFQTSTNATIQTLVLTDLHVEISTEITPASVHLVSGQLQAVAVKVRLYVLWKQLLDV